MSLSDQLVATDPVFSVLDVRPVAHAAAPTLEFSMHVSDPNGRQVHTIALATQIRIDPARRRYDPETRERLVGLFGAPERWAATKYFYSLPVDGGIPLSFHFTGMVLYAGEHDRLQVAQVPWSCSTQWMMPVAEWQRAIRAFYPEGGWVRLTTATLDALLQRKDARGDHDFDRTVAELLEADPR